MNTDKNFVQAMDIFKQNKKLFIPYLTYGYPDRKRFAEILMAVAQTNVDAIEIGMPFSDPVADGPVIQRSSQVALGKGATLPGLLSDLKRLKQKINVPLAVMTYYNPVFFMGDDAFCQKAQGIIDAVVIPDLLPEEAGGFIRAANASAVKTVFFIAPTTDQKRFSLINSCSTGFVYYVSVTGTTGSRTQFDAEIFKKIAQAKKRLTRPVIVGFGISTHQQVKAFWKVADGVIVGSAIIRFISEQYRQKDFIVKLKRYIGILSGRSF